MATTTREDIYTVGCLLVRFRTCWERIESYQRLETIFRTPVLCGEKGGADEPGCVISRHDTLGTWSTTVGVYSS
jgi:hypothetical protein